MDCTLEPILEEMEREIDTWITYIRDKDAEKIVKRTTLQVGIHGNALLEYAKGRVDVTDKELDLTKPKGQVNLDESLTEEEVQAKIIPKLASYIQEKLNELPSALIDYRFTFNGKFRTRDGRINVLIHEYVDETKKEQLLEQISVYIANKLEAGNFPTKPLETFFLSRHLLDEGLYPDPDPGRIISIFESIQQVNKGNKHLAEHRNYIVSALRNWVEDYGLPLYYDNTGTEWQKTYQKKDGAWLEKTEQGPIELVIYTAIMILKYEPSYSKSTGLAFMNYAIELGSAEAKRLMKEGSGTFAKEDTGLCDELVECTANDVLAQITIAIKQETEESYARALQFLIRLLSQGFPKSYQIKLKSGVKQWLPVKGLAKSSTHRFFANALEYPNLHPLLEQYSHTAMETFEWYSDTEGEKNCMPGSYAVFGLGLTDQTYFPLVEQYMGKVDEEHQSVQNHFTVALAERFGVNAETIPTLVKCMLHSTDSMKLKIKAEMEDEKHLRLLLAQIHGLPDYMVEHIVYLIWGGTDKLKKIAANADGDRGKWLSKLVRAASSS
ncbi:DUF6138 family protein [Paenibacillus radicis (ex Gao et al. 2016)]|uniref:Uncharacterized protein n=1 Tax=Paenibacillus radicis (ex Gao et al. 2016) TaxID=1737354 RepID=A0A917M052_9BACL|nr:DUF6138 family protein [Paenibacillus radicis (ex Gao et al. 2016)]GGG69220.1 hypothetical protein GCM10010918_25430 [Paenibacillus radicis (ex Gao et al. 2016)]